MPAPAQRRCPDPDRSLRVIRARQNNLKDLTLSIPLGLLVCVTGVSGSGKSTLIDQVLYRNLQRHFGLGVSEPGLCDAIKGAERLSGVVLVDQSPPGRTSRMNAATYMAVMGPLRDQFAATEQARLRGLGPSAFSFNSAAGACPHCKGAGYEKIELQFLPDVYVRCAGCDGHRFRPDVLEVRCRGHTIAEVLDLPARDVAQLFADDARVSAALQPLLDIGLGYLSLAQPATTLSGGEAQRLKLARQLGEAQHGQNLLFILDEPTTGLHPADVSTMLGALHSLIDGGHSVIIVEHNMDVARAADWVIDLGPEGGDRGGELVGEGPPERVAELATPTGGALSMAFAGIEARLREGRAAPIAVSPGRTRPVAPDDFIHILGAREHNLRDVRLKIPRSQLVAITGVSGSGKSTLAFDVLHAEGQRRFLDCLPTYARQFIRPLARPDVDRVEGIPPTVSLEQKLSRGSSMSTVGTSSEVYHYLRLLFAALGIGYCSTCNVPGEAIEPSDLADRIAGDFFDEGIVVLAPLVRKRKGHHREIIAAVGKRGLREVRVDGRLYNVGDVPRLDRYRIHDIEAVVAHVHDGPEYGARLRAAVGPALELGAGALIIVSRRRPDRFYSTRRACPRCGAGIPAADPRLFTWSRSFGACPVCQGSGVEPSTNHSAPCSACGGSRLRPEALAVRIGERNIGEVAALTVRDARLWGKKLRGGAEEVRQRIVPELDARLALLEKLGVGYLALDRSADTLSTGEAQRIRIVAHLASNLRGVCYVLDEPTVGLHPRDTAALTHALIRLRERGNTVVVVEHEEAVIRAADHVIDLGPGAGPDGGRVVAVGVPSAIASSKRSLTGLWLRGEGARPIWPRRPLEIAPRLKLVGARLHNLRNLAVEIPLGRLVCITGVSGSGKSTLVRDVMLRALKARLANQELPPILKGLRGADLIDRAVEVDESPIGRTPRSVPATYVGIMDAIRAIYASMPEARARGYAKGRFSFNVPGGRCERCQGQGRLEVKMALLPPVYTTCEACGSQRYNLDTLAVAFKGRTIADALGMSINEARELFSAFPAVCRPLDFLIDIGLGYLTLGQPSPTLSGGEAQRIKLAAELAAPGSGRSLYILDEPTTGLHMADVARLLKVLQRLVERGNTVVVVEHNLDVACAADCIIDLGPEGGEAGGRVIAWGPPEHVATVRLSRTAPFLRRALGDARRSKEQVAPRALARASKQSSSSAA
jgi:excinuclease ABC subunit A